MSRPWMPLYVSQYLADTSHLSTQEHGAYLLLIMHYWQRGGLPNDKRKLASIARLPLEQWDDISGTIAEFFTVGWRHERIERELRKALEAYEKRALAGSKGGKMKASNAASNATAGLEHCSTIDIDTSSTKKEKREPNGSPKKTNATRIPDDFVPDEAWAVANGLTPTQAHREAAQFVDFWHAKSGAGGTKRDWPATWRVWVRNINKRPQPRSGSPPKPLTQGESIRNMARQRGIIDDTGNPVRRVETSERDGEDSGAGNVIRFALSSDYGWGDG